MSLGQRVKERMDALGLSQAELARRVDLSQPSIWALLKKNKTGSRSLHRIARELGTTPAYLTGETDDPDEGAPPPRPEPHIQHVSLPVALPDQRALAQAFEALLSASREMSEVELSRELARRLPTLIRIAGGALPSSRTLEDDEADELAEALASDPPQRRRA